MFKSYKYGIQHHVYVAKYHFMEETTIFYGCSEGRYDYPQIAIGKCHAGGALFFKKLWWGNLFC